MLRSDFIVGYFYYLAGEGAEPRAKGGPAKDVLHCQGDPHNRENVCYDFLCSLLLHFKQKVYAILINGLIYTHVCVPTPTHVNLGILYKLSQKKQFFMIAKCRVLGPTEIC